jgi:DNA repair exonuclease SbcCD nuclease subunit
MDCEGLLEDFRAEGKARYQIGLLHGDPVQRHSPYCPVTAAQVRDSGLDYLALGHVHKSGAFRAGKTLCGWPGCPMGRGYDETGEMGLYLVEIGENAKIRKLFLPTPRFYDVTVNTDEQSPEDVLPGAGSNDFYRLTLTGAREMEGTMLARFPNLVLRDNREAQRDLWFSADEDTLEGTYFRILREALEGADERDAERIRRAAAISRKILEGREVVL